MIDPLLELPLHARSRLAQALSAGQIGPPYAAASVRSVLGASEDLGQIAESLGRLERAGTPAQAIAMILEAANRAAAETKAPDFVWSGPEVPGLHARDTRAVYEEVIGDAASSIWACTYAFFDGQKAFKVLAKCMDDNTTLNVSLLLNIQRKWGDTTAPERLVRKFADRFWDTDWPGEARPDVFYDPRSLELEGPGSVLHAKAVVADDQLVFVTSANFTEAALDRNIEIGLLTRDRTLALTIVSHFRGLINRDLLHPLPAD